jgi:hypothetical protein
LPAPAPRCGRGPATHRLLHVPEELFEHRGHLGGRLVAVGRVLGVELFDHGGQALGHGRVQLAHRPRLLVGDAPQHRQRRRRPERRPPDAHRVEHAAQAEEVGAVVGRLPPRLLRRHVLRRAGDDPALRQAGVVHRPRQAEVGEHDPLDAVLQQDVGRLDVAVDDPLGVGGGQAQRRLPADPQHGRDVQRPVPVDALLQRAPGDARHHQVGQPAGLVGVHGVDGDDVVVDDRGGRLRLAGEPLPRRPAGGQQRREHLDGHGAAQGRLPGLEHHAHAALAEHAEHLVGAEPAQVARLVRRRQEAQVGVFRRDRPTRLRAHARLVLRHRPDERPHLVPPAAAGHRLQLGAALLAVLQVLGEVARAGVLGAGVVEEFAEPVRVAAVAVGYHRLSPGSGLAGVYLPSTSSTFERMRARTRLRAM